MRLSAEQFAELAASFQSAGASSQHERRRAARIGLQARVKITPFDSSHALASQQVTVCDFSTRGLALLYSGTLLYGQQFVTELPRKGGGVVQLLCRVAHIREVPNGMVRIGAEFVCTVSPQGPAAANPSSGERTAEMDRIRQSMLG